MNKSARKTTKKGRKALACLALQRGRSWSDMNAEIQAVIDATWETPSPELLQLFQGGKPTPAFFIGTLAEQVSELNAQHSSS